MVLFGNLEIIRERKLADLSSDFLLEREERGSNQPHFPGLTLLTEMITTLELSSHSSLIIFKVTIGALTNKCKYIKGI